MDMPTLFDAVPDAPPDGMASARESTRARRLPGTGGPTGPRGIISADGLTRDGPLRLRPAAQGVRAAATLPRRHRRTLLAIDGNSLVHRAYHAYGDQALYGTLALLAGLADKVSFDALVVGFDDSSRSWRRHRWAGYKAQRPAKPATLTALLERVPQLLDRLGMTVVTAEGHEADDVLGSAAAVATASGWCSVLATSDRDAYGLVDDQTTVLRLRSGLDNALPVTPRTIRSTIGIDPCQYVAFAALRGDPSDNLPGIPGIGRSRAKALLAAYPTVEAAVADEIGCLSVLGRDLGRVLLDDLAAPNSVFRRNVELMTIRRDVVISLDVCGRRLPYDAVERTCVAEGLAPVAGRMAAGFGARPSVSPPPLEPLD